MNVPGVRREGRMDVDVGTVDESDNVISATRRRRRDVYELSRVEVGRTLITLIKSNQIKSNQIKSNQIKNFRERFRLH